ncbi:hypothetical protein ACWCQN_18445 [Streptomyces sp. NPDC001984]|uniref:hypothetical protein n=1 Tax=unclassified Streptomyces TaxID=2593676 RepID=UPI00367E76BA
MTVSERARRSSGPELVAGGQIVAFGPAGFRTGLRPDLASVPVEGVEPVQVVLVTRRDDRNPLLSAFRACAAAHLTA